MKIQFYLLATATLFSSQLSFSATQIPKTGLELADMVYLRDTAKDSMSIGKMILIEKGHKPRERVSTTYSQNKTPGDVKTLIRFSAPADVKNTSLLGVDAVGKKNSQWLFLPALKRVRKISSDRKSGRFVGSDIYYEDMQDRAPEKDIHKLLATKKIKGVSCQLMESKPKPEHSSAYSKRIACIHLKTLLPLNVEFFKDDRLVKTWQTVKMKKIQSYWTITESLITDSESGHITRLVTQKIVYDQGLPDKLFSQKVLEDPGVEKQFVNNN